jgi:hypothetical protein
MLAGGLMIAAAIATLAVRGPRHAAA